MFCSPFLLAVFGQGPGGAALRVAGGGGLQLTAPATATAD